MFSATDAIAAASGPAPRNRCSTASSATTPAAPAARNAASSAASVGKWSAVLATNPA